MPFRCFFKGFRYGSSSSNYLYRFASFIFLVVSVAAAAVNVMNE
jgi:hypothetical protein